MVTQEGQEGVVEDDSMAHDHAYQPVPSKAEPETSLNRMGITAHTIAVQPLSEINNDGNSVVEISLSTGGYGAGTSGEDNIKELCLTDMY